MNRVIPSDPMSAPHLLINRLSPSRSGKLFTPSHVSLLPEISPKVIANMRFNYSDQHLNVHSMSNRKRKASEEPDNDRMSTSPAASPSVSNRTLAPRSFKRTRTGSSGGRPLSVPRLLETLSADEIRQLLLNICHERPDLQQELVTKAPRPSIDSTLAVLGKYELDFRDAFPLGDSPSSDYAYNRVRQHLLQLIEALHDFTPHFLPPHESQTALSFNYLDAVTNMIHRLPDWDTFQHQRHKNDAYDELSKAWALVIREAAKRAGGIHLQLGAWDQKLVEHNQKSGGKMEEAVNELRTGMGYLQPTPAGPSTGGASDERAFIRSQLFSGTYGQQLGVGPGGW